MTYDEMLSLNDEKLIAANITLGARKKIISNLDKLRERPNRLQQLCSVSYDLLQCKILLLLYNKRIYDFLDNR